MSGSGAVPSAPQGIAGALSADQLAALCKPHRPYPDAVLWRLTESGISVNGLPAIGTPGLPMTVHRIWDWFGNPIRDAANRTGAPVELLVATIANESAGGQTNLSAVAGARREEPGYISDDETPSRVSIGVMQTLISTAREALGRSTLRGTDLLDPATSILAGAYVMKDGWSHTRYDPPLVGAAYNAGGVYYEASSANRWRMRCFPLGSGQYIDRLIPYFNDAFQVCMADPTLAGGAPSFAAAIAALMTPAS